MSKAEFKDSPIGKIPKDWDVLPLGSVVKSTILGTTARGISAVDGNIPLIKMGNLNWGKLVLNQIEHVHRSAIPEMKTLKLEYGDLLFNTRNTPELVGKTAVWRNELTEAVYDNNLLRIRFRKGIAPPFVCAYMSTGAGKRRMHSLVTGTTSVAAIYWKNLESYLLPWPRPEEQHRIAEILDTIDETIQKTEAVIAKLKGMRDGLLHDLLTRGLDEHGKLRDPIVHPEQFKDSPLGRIPREWEVRQLIDIAVGGISNGFFKKPELVGSGYRLVNVSDLYQDFGVDLNLVERVNATKPVFNTS